MKKLRNEILVVICMSMCIFIMMGGTHGNDAVFNQVKVNNRVDVDSAYCHQGVDGLNFTDSLFFQNGSGGIFKIRWIIKEWRGGIVCDTSLSDWAEIDTQQ